MRISFKKFIDNNCSEFINFLRNYSKDLYQLKRDRYEHSLYIGNFGFNTPDFIPRLAVVRPGAATKLTFNLTEFDNNHTAKATLVQYGFGVEIFKAIINDYISIPPARFAKNLLTVKLYVAKGKIFWLNLTGLCSLPLAKIILPKIIFRKNIIKTFKKKVTPVDYQYKKLSRDRFITNKELFKLFVLSAAIECDINFKSFVKKLITKKLFVVKLA